MIGRPPPFFTFALRIIPVLAALTVEARGELTQQEISAALGTPESQTWTLTSPASTPWTASSAGLQFATASAGAVCAIETTFQGPGVAATKIAHPYGAYEVSVWVDGVLSGSKDSQANSIQRAEVGAGNHTVRWQMKRNATSGITSATLSKATWTPFTVQPLSAGAKGDGVALTSEGTRPWIGQNAWHHGDGAAAWSRVKLNASEADVPLRATFQGAGVFSYSYRVNGEGFVNFKFDGGTPVDDSSYGPNEAWETRWMHVGAGGHVMEWRAGAFAEAYTRVSCDVAVDEVRLRQTVPLADALETPGWNWTAESSIGGTPNVAGVQDAGASGGSVALVGPGTEIQSPVSGGRLLKIRSRGGIPRVRFDTWLTELTHTGDPASGGWVESIWALEEGDFNLRIYGGGWDFEIDRVELLPLPTTLAEALGLPEGSFTTGGAGAWNVAMYSQVSGYGARVKAIPYQGDSWLEIPVTGPAAVDFSWKTDRNSSNLRLLVDGTEVDRIGSDKARIEVPAGTHAMRWLVSPYDQTGGDFSAYVGGITVTPLPEGGAALGALDLQIPVSITPGWRVSAGLSRDGGTVWRGPAVTASSPGYYHQQQVKASFTGPGELSFWWYAEKVDGDLPDWYFEKIDSYPYFSRAEVSGWKQEKLWIPPGTALFQWSVSGTAEKIALTALDGIKFTPSATVPLGEALDAPQLDWQNDPIKPWLPVVVKDPAGDMALCPSLASGESSHFSTTVKGPGTISFRWQDFRPHYTLGTFSANGMVLNSFRNNSNDQLIEIFVPASSPVKLEWTATSLVSDGLISVDKVKWTPAPVSPLATSLDTPASVKWKTSADIPFVGFDDAGAKGGTSAFVGLLPGEESWLEATVEGPGLFDFWLRKEAYMDLPGNLWRFWSLSIDDKPVAIHGYSWPSQWIAGAGKHRIRLTLTNNSDEWIASGVDNVSWSPLETTSLKIAGGVPGQKWKTGKAVPATGLANSGRNGDPAILVRPGRQEASWVTTQVEGPCEISWDSALDRVDNSVQILQVDGIDALPVIPHPWKRMRLTLPKGDHSVRWISRPAPDEANPGDAFASWRLSGIAITQGFSPLARALDFEGLFALETGDTGGRLIRSGNDDEWEPARDSSLYFFDPHRAGKFSTQWGRPDTASQHWEYEDSNGDHHHLKGYTPGWHDHFTSIRPGQFVKWTYSKENGKVPSFLNQLKFDGKVEKPVDLAIDSPQPLSDGGWIGLPDTDAVTGGDSAWSLLNDPSNPQSASLTLTGPAKVSFWWKVQGPGTLRLNLDGACLPVPAADKPWRKVEFAINSGEHVIEWKHAATKGMNFSKPSEAFLDGLKIVKAASHTLAKAAALDPSLPVASVGIGEPAKPWHPAAYREANGSWTEAARAIAGSSALSVTVTGPAVLEFRGRCFAGVPEPSPQKKINHSVVIIIVPGDGEKTLGHFLSVQVDATQSFKIQSDPSGAWKDGAVHVPEGTHQVTFQLKTLKSRWSTEYMEDATLPSLQGWVDDLNIVSSADRFAKWAHDQYLSGAMAAQDADPDADGASNFLEYSFETNPRNAASRPAPLEMSASADRRDKKFHRRLKLPYLPPHVSGILQSSTDMVHWVNEPTPLLHYPPPAPAPVIGGDEETLDYPYLPVPTDTPQKLYRIWISDKGPAN